MKDYRLDKEIAKIDQKIGEISARHLKVRYTPKRADTILGSLLVKVVADILSLMALGVILGYLLNKQFNIKGPLCFVICTVIACLACVKNIIKIR
jgi:F0F1-type ATP synthase assembly protein I